MAHLPVLFSERNDPFFNRWHNFGQGIHPNEIEAFSCPRSFYNQHHTGHRWQQSLDHVNRENVARSSIGKDGYQASFDVHQFAPNEITVETVDDNVIIKAQHEERLDDHGFIQRQFTRRFTIPDGFQINDVVSQISSDGVLTIKAPPPKKQLDEKARVVHIQHTGLARLSIGNKEDEKKEVNKVLVK